MYREGRVLGAPEDHTLYGPADCSLQFSRGRQVQMGEEQALVYEPQPIDTSEVQLSEEIIGLTEQLAKNAHATWARQRLKEGWRYGPQRDDARKEHPCLVPYDSLPESEKEYDRSVALATLKALLAMGYRIEKVP
jgi:hypothetical protein